MQIRAYAETLTIDDEALDAWPKGKTKEHVCFFILIFGCKRCGLMGHLFSCISLMALHWRWVFSSSLFWKGRFDWSWGARFDLESVLENVYSGEEAVFDPATPNLSRPVANYTTHLYIQLFLSSSCFLSFLFLFGLRVGGKRESRGTQVYLGL